jgi:putative ABC transport system permease protein
MLIMVFFAISNTVSMSVVERTREIGTLRAIGTYSREILKNFMLEGLVIGVLGSLVGMLIGLSISFLSTVAGFTMPPPPGRAEGYPLVISAPLDIYMNVSITIVVVCVLAAWLASWKAVNKTIVEALAHV